MDRQVNSRIKDEELYEELREEGNSKQKSARIANAAAREGRSVIGKRGGEAGSYEDWTKKELMDKARQVGIPRRSTMNKGELIRALRNS